MNISLVTVLAAIRLAGSTLPAFKALFDEILQLFGEDDQATLKRAYEEERAKTDADHLQTQDVLDAASKR